MDWIEAQTPNVMEFVGKDFGKWLGWDKVMKVGPSWRDYYLYKKRKGDQSSLSLYHVRTQQEDTICKPGRAS